MLALSEPGKTRFAYGFWRWREDEVDAALAMLACLREAGIAHLDTADVYDDGGSERLLGAIRARARGLFDGAVLATKAGTEHGSPYNSSRAYLTAVCEASLKRLKVERVDLFYIHRPDLLTHPEELAGTLEALVASGKVGAIGVSNFTPSQVAALAHYLTLPIAVHQLEFSAAHVDPVFDGTLDQAMECGIAVAAWSPLAGGRLGEGDAGPQLKRVREALAAIAARAGVTPTAAALAFVQRHPASPTPILGTKKERRLRDALTAGELTLSRQDWYAIVEAWHGEEMP
jgi:predicted oxidoreductase